MFVTRMALTGLMNVHKASRPLSRTTLSSFFRRHDSAAQVFATKRWLGTGTLPRNAGSTTSPLPGKPSVLGKPDFCCVFSQPSTVTLYPRPFLATFETAWGRNADQPRAVARGTQFFFALSLVKVLRNITVAISQSLTGHDASNPLLKRYTTQMLTKFQILVFTEL